MQHDQIVPNDVLMGENYSVMYNFGAGHLRSTASGEVPSSHYQSLGHSVQRIDYHATVLVIQYYLPYTFNNKPRIVNIEILMVMMLE